LPQWYWGFQRGFVMYVGIDLVAKVLPSIAKSPMTINQAIQGLETGLKLCIKPGLGDFELIVTATQAFALDGCNLSVYLYGVDSEVDTVQAKEYLAESLRKIVLVDSLVCQEFNDFNCEGDTVEGVFVDSDFKLASIS